MGAPRVFATGGVQAEDIAAGDLDNDGDIDLAVTHFQTNDVTVFLNDGSGWFTPSTPVSVHDGNSIGPIKLGDFDQDGDLDIVVGTSQQRVSVLLNNGDGTFAPYLSYPAFSLPADIVVQDIDHDGDVDLVCPGWNGLSLLRNDGGGVFEDELLILDVSLDLVSGAVGDVDGDWDCDIVQLDSYYDSISIVDNERPFVSVARAYAARNYAKTLAVAELTGDAALDIISASRSSSAVLLWPNDGSGGFSPYIEIPAGQGVEAVVPADMNGDGLTDMVLASSVDRIHVLINSGSGTFQSPVLFSTTDRPAALCAADFNGDGAVDIATANGMNNTISVLINDVCLDIDFDSICFSDATVRISATPIRQTLTPMASAMSASMATLFREIGSQLIFLTVSSLYLTACR